MRGQWSSDLRQAIKISTPLSPLYAPCLTQFLAQKFETVFDKYNILLRSSNYVTRRQSLKLLGELLLDRANFQVMMRYIQVTGERGGGGVEFARVPKV